MSLDVLHKALMRIAKRHRMDTGYSAFGPDVDTVCAETEAAAHELVHALYLGKPCSSDAIGNMIRDMPDAIADEHELSTLRVESHALSKLGHEVDGHYLSDTANFRGNTPSHARFDLPLTAYELAMSEWFVEVVEKEIRSRK